MKRFNGRTTKMAILRDVTGDVNCSSYNYRTRQDGMEQELKNVTYIIEVKTPRTKNESPWYIDIQTFLRRTNGTSIGLRSSELPPSRTFSGRPIQTIQLHGLLK